MQKTHLGECMQPAGFTQAGRMCSIRILPPVPSLAWLSCHSNESSAMHLQLSGTTYHP